jgi:hypothetical protein
MWAIDIDKSGHDDAATVLVMARDIRSALEAVEKRYPKLMRPGTSKGKGWLCDNAVYRPDSGRFECVRLRSE